MTAADRARRERVRWQAAELFAGGVPPPAVARRLRVSRKSAYAWHQRWEADGRDGLRSAGPAVRCRLDGEQLARLAVAVDRGPAAHGGQVDQRWMLARLATLIERLVGQSYPLTGVAKLLHRRGIPPSVRSTGPPDAVRASRPPAPAVLPAARPPGTNGGAERFHRR